MKRGLKMLLKNPKKIILAGINAQEQTHFKEETIKQYGLERLPTINILDLFPNLDEEITPYSFLTGTSMITDLVLLKSLAKRFENCAYLEIGSWRGESLCNVSSVTNDLTSLTLSAKEMKEMNISEEFIKVHGFFSNNIKSIKKIEANSHDFDFNKLEKKFDLIFVDGDHSYAGVLNDTKKVFPIRKDSKSIIVWHDYGFKTDNTRYTTLKAILDGIPNEKHSNLYHVSNTMCAVYIEDLDLPTKQTIFPSTPENNFTIQIKGTKL